MVGILTMVNQKMEAVKPLIISDFNLSQSIRETNASFGLAGVMPVDFCC